MNRSPFIAAVAVPIHNYHCWSEWAMAHRRCMCVSPTPSLPFRIEWFLFKRGRSVTIWKLLGINVVNGCYSIEMNKILNIHCAGRIVCVSARTRRQPFFFAPARQDGGLNRCWSSFRRSLIKSHPCPFPCFLGTLPSLPLSHGTRPLQISGYQYFR